MTLNIMTLSIRDINKMTLITTILSIFKKKVSKDEPASEEHHSLRIMTLRKMEPSIMTLIATNLGIFEKKNFFK